MMRSLYSAVSGLKNHQTRQDVIGNNIANVNTTGFKASRVNFQDILSQTLQGASAPNGNTAGSNPMQVGLGMAVGSIETLFTDGNIQSTGKQTDLAIQGDGFFIVSDNGGTNQYYTRAGNFDFDAAGNYYLPGTSLQVIGYDVDSTGKIDTGKLVPLVINDSKKTMAPKATSGFTFTKNLTADAVTDDPSTTSIVDPTTASGTVTIYDSMGKGTKLNAVFTFTGSNTWKLDFYDPASATPTTPLATVSPITFASVTDSAAVPPTTAGKITTPPTSVTISGKPFTLDLTGLTMYGGESTLKSDYDGYAQGSLTKKTISASGIITGTYDNGESQTLGQVALASFTNPGGLDKVGETMFVKSSNSGNPAIGIPGTGGLGKTSSGSLEMSNVNLSDEMTNMIITQRGFQSNSKIITTDDEMLEILANLKR